MKVRLISTHKGMQEIEDRWNKIIRENSKSPFLFTTFCDQLFDPINMPHIKPTFLVISVDNEVVGVCPTGIIDAGIRFSRFIIKDFQPDIICENEYREICIKYSIAFLFRNLKCKFASFSFQANSLNIDLLEKICRNLGFYTFTNLETGHSILEVIDSWRDFERRRGRQYRKLIRRIEKRLNTLGPWKISCLGEEADKSETIKRISEIDKKSWKLAHWQQIGRNFDPSLNFYWKGSTQTALKEDEFDWKVAILELEEKDVAYSLFTIFKQTAYTCKTSFDECYRHLYPGIYVKHSVIRELFSRSEIKEIDFMSNQTFHRKWTPSPTPTIKLYVSRSRLILILLRHFQHNKLFQAGLAGLALISRKAQSLQSGLYFE